MDNLIQSKEIIMTTCDEQEKKELPGMFCVKQCKYMMVKHNP